MKLKDGVIITEVNREFVAVDTGADGKRFNGMIRLNHTAAFVARQLQSERTVEEIVQAMTAKYDVSDETARRDVHKVVEALSSVGLILQ